MMKLEFLFFLLYIAIAILIIPKIKFIKAAGLTISEIRILMTAKLIIAILSAGYLSGLQVLSDSVAYNIEGKIQYDILISNPSMFFDEFKNDIKLYGLGNLFGADNSLWGYLRFHIVYKFLAILNFMTRGNFYFNSVVFSSLVFFGNIAFFRIYNDIYPGRKILKIATCFFLPSMALFTACVHKDGFVFLALGISSYVFYNLLQPKNIINIKKIVALITAIICIFLFRNYVLVAMLPAIFVALIVSRVNNYKAIIVVGFYLIAVVLFFATGFFNNSFNLPQAVIKRKADFALLEKGSSNLEMRELSPNVISFAKNTPQAINHVMLRPYPTEFGTLSSLVVSLELYFYLCLMLILLLQYRRGSLAKINSFNIYGIAFFISMVLIIGFTIPNAGAITRYRSIIWVFIICPLAGNLSLNKLPRLFSK